MEDFTIVRLMLAKQYASAAVMAMSWKAVQKEHANLMEHGLVGLLGADVSGTLPYTYTYTISIIILYIDPNINIITHVLFITQLYQTVEHCLHQQMEMLSFHRGVT